MDIQTLKPIFLDYFWEQMRKGEEIEIDNLVSMAQNVEITAKTMDELLDEKLIEGIKIIWRDEKPLFQSSHDAKLTEKGIKQVARKNALEDIIPEQVNLQEEKKQPKKLSAEDLINQAEKNRKKRISSLSIEEKYDAIKKEILIFFCGLTHEALDDNDKPYTLYKIRGKIREIEASYFPSSGYHLEYIINQILYKNALIRYRHGREFISENEKIGFENFITKKGVKELEEKYSYCFNKPLGQMTDKEFQETFGNVVPNLSKSLGHIVAGGALSQVAKLNLTSPLIEASKAISASSGILKSAQNMLPLKDLTSAAIKTQNLYGNELSNNSKNIANKKDKNNFTFEGILGQNCGTVVEPTGEDEKRIQEKGFKVKEGIRVLRGFAKSSDLAAFSQPDQNYQRDKKTEHLEHLKEFIKLMKTSAKYIPEVTLVARGYEKLEPIKFSGTLTTTQQGELDNLEYCKLTVNRNQVYRIDGNHRLLATEEDNYYIPFSIIVWDKSKVNQDDEAFLFYFLNSKARKLTTEENLKGLVNATTWTNEELKQANILLPYIKSFYDEFENNILFDKSFYKDGIGRENSKCQYLNILEKILLEESKDNLEQVTTEISFKIEQFREMVKLTQSILQRKDILKYLRKEFRCLPQFIFYTIYKLKDIKDIEEFLYTTNNWAKYYKHNANSIDCPIKMFNNALKQTSKKIKIFVAMPYYNDETVEQFNVSISALVNELKKEHTLLSSKLELSPIMKYKAESTDILSNMDKEINGCDIFIADISKHNKSNTNPNVMFELGRVLGKTPFILLKNSKDKQNEKSFDIEHWSHEKINFSTLDISLKKTLKPKIIEILKNQLGIELQS